MKSKSQIQENKHAHYPKKLLSFIGISALLLPAYIACAVYAPDIFNKVFASTTTSAPAAFQAIGILSICASFLVMHKNNCSRLDQATAMKLNSLAFMIAVGTYALGSLLTIETASQMFYTIIRPLGQFVS